MGKRLYRSRTNKVLAGVCGGLGEYFAIDPTIVRLICIAAAIFGGTGILVYIVAAIIMPEETASDRFNSFNKVDDTDFNIGSDEWKEPAWKETPRYDSEKSKLIIGGALVLFGVIFLVKQLFSFSMSYLWPVLLVGLGVALLFRGRR